MITPSIGTKGLRVDRLDPPCLVIGQRGEFLFAGAVRKVATILVKETEEQIGQPLGHVDKGIHLLPELIVALHKSGFVGKIPFDRPLNAGIEEFGVRGCIENR
ncbi:hypothetical protein [Mesorhizobium caraganae]|uniref:hypothetical protein n=1 Tax=Mesorhizobium caraganae TaxID=483206 RepID=UPI00289F5C63|nr:hypothetical protein [Mesorhizobium caraganae]